MEEEKKKERLNQLLTILNKDKKNNPFFYVKPQDYQKSFMECQKMIRIIVGGNFSGKTMLSLLDLSLCLTGNNYYQPNFPKPPIKARIIGISFKEYIGAIIYPKLREFLSDFWVKDTKKNQQGVVSYILLKDKIGSEVTMMSNEQDDVFFEGWKGHYLLCDEPIKRPAIIASLRGLYDVNCKAVFNLTPIEDAARKINYDDLAYLYDEFYCKASENGGDNDDIATFNWTRLQNKFLSKEMTKKYIKLLREDEIESRIYGKWQFLMGLTFTDFDKEKMIIDEFDLDDKKWTKFIAIDPHSVSETGVLFLGIDRDGTCVIFDELYEADMIIDELCNKIKAKKEGHKIKRQYIDSQAAERNVITNITYIDEFRKRLGGIIAAKRDRREVGITAIKQLIANKKLFVFRKCRNFISEITKFRNLAKDKDHLLDGLRYLLTSNIYYCDPEKEKEQRKRSYDPLYNP